MVMTQEEKELLLKDLCARLPYGVKVHIQKLDDNKVIDNEDFGYMWLGMVLFDNPYHEIKPYLRPMSSMTEEESKEFALLQTDFYVDGFLYPIAAINMVNWLNEHHFDVRNLIEKGLAIDCTGLNIY